MRTWVARSPRAGVLRFGASAVIGMTVIVLLPSVASAVTPSEVTTPVTASSGALGTGPLVPLGGSTPVIPASSTVLGATDPSTTITVDVALRPRDPTGLASFAAAVSTPGSPRYHRYLAAGQLASAFGPTPQVLFATRHWLASRGLALGATSGTGLLVPVTGTAAALESAFAVPLVQTRLRDGRVARLATRDPVVPSTLAPALAGVVGLSDDTRQAPHLDGQTPIAGASSAQAGVGALDQTLSGPQACPAAAGLSGDHGPWTAAQLASTYGLSHLYAGGRDGSGQTVGIYELEPYTASDIAAYESCYGIDVPVTDVQVDGGAGTNAQLGEAALDIEAVAGLAPGASIEVYTGPNSGGGPIDTYDRMVNDDTAKVITTSWGSCENQMSPSDQGVENSLFTMAAAQGQTVLAASGDSGSSDCADQGGSDALGVDDPASQPEVTGVGGTSLNSATADSPTEQVWNDLSGASGGGNSQTFAAPTWQTGAATQVTGTVADCGTGGHKQCREVPDVAASADPVEGDLIYFDGGWSRIGGTSAAAPLWAALVAVADQGCDTTAGFLDPALYSSGATADVHDITIGNNNIAGNPSEYPALGGYDLATGWGSPRADLLLGLLTAGCPSVTAVSPSTGPAVGGTTVTISGSDFGTAAPTVTIGGVTAPVQAHTQTSVTVVTPDVGTPRAAIVAVTSSTGTSASTPVSAFTFYGPQVTSVVSPRGPVSGGGSVTVSGTRLDGATSVSFGGRPATRFQVIDPETIDATVPAGSSQGGTVDVVVTTGSGTSAPGVGDRYTYALPGYWMVASDGGIFAFGAAGFFGSAGGQGLGAPIVSLAATPDDQGYWMTGADGAVLHYGDAGSYGSTAGQALNRPIVHMAATPDGQGYWLVASDGGIFAYGDAGFYGSTGNLVLNKPVVGMASTPDGRGYWLVAADGGIFAYGDAGFYGSTGNLHLNQPIVGMAPTADGRGYWLVAADGGIFAYGDAGFYGSTGGMTLNRPIVGMGVDLTGDGYWLVASDGGIFAFGSAPFDGSTGNLVLNRPITGMAAT